MRLDHNVAEAVRVAVQNAGQPATLVERITKWLEVVNSRTELSDDQDEDARHLDSLFNGTELPNYRRTASNR
ncbi:MAG: hypothetical protein OXH60_04515 [Rhodospirillales bacterium]|nr:hypothetical protein [Rhodospirillales bacterium]